MENILVLGSSLAKQVVQHNDRNGRKIDNILFKGKINLKSIDSTLRDKNKQYKKVIYLSGNDLLPHCTQKTSFLLNHPQELLLLLKILSVCFMTKVQPIDSEK